MSDDPRGQVLGMVGIALLWLLLWPAIVVAWWLWRARQVVTGVPR